jgi:acyl carrier protein
MSETEKIEQTLYTVIDEINAELPEGDQLERSSNTVLFGEAGKLDSMGLVSFVVAAEQKIQEAFGKAISITDERALSQRNSPFRTVGTLVDYVSTLLQGMGHD